MTDDVRDELADAIMEIYGDASAEQLADALMPAVERIANKRAATELREMATVTVNGDDRWQLRDRAAALEAGARVISSNRRRGA